MHRQQVSREFFFFHFSHFYAKTKKKYLEITEMREGERHREEREHGPYFLSDWKILKNVFHFYCSANRSVTTFLSVIRENSMIIAMILIFFSLLNKETYDRRCPCLS